MKPETARRDDIDWLRVFATYLLLLFHVGMVFNPAPFFHIRNADVSFVFLILCGFIGLWHMPLFFLLAGWSACSSLALRGPRDFLKERFFRLVVPFVAGCVVLMPAIKFFERSSGLDANYKGLFVAAELQRSFRQVIPTGLPVAAPFNESFLGFLPTFFTDPLRFTWAHLWFIFYLLLFTVLYLPLLQYARRPTRWFQGEVRAGWAYVPLVPLVVIQLSMRERWPGLPNLLQDWANVAYYSTYLLCGFLLARFPQLETVVQQERKRALAIACGATTVLLVGVLGGVPSPPLLLASVAVAGWCFVVALLGWSHRHLSFSTPRLRDLTESAFPVYLLHQAAIVIPGYFLIQLPLGVWAKFALLLLVSTSLTLAAYRMLVRPFALTRFLCGMQGRGRPGRRPLAAAATAATLVVATCAVVGSAPARGASRAGSVAALGRWYVEGGAAQVEISDCAGDLCGRVVWLRSPFDEDGCELRDRNNPSAAERDRSIVGLEILRAHLSGSGDAAADTCTVYDPLSGRTYHCQLWFDGDDRLRLRGYLGVPLFGRTATWLRVGSEARTCQERSASSADARVSSAGDDARAGRAE
jgi:uncharacterized protein (DUF2147 family)